MPTGSSHHTYDTESEETSEQPSSVESEGIGSLASENRIREGELSDTRHMEETIQFDHP